MTRRFLRMVGRTLVGMLLFAQMAIAAYACPGLLAGSSSAEMQTASTAMRVPDGGDTSMPSADAQVANCSDMAGAMDSSSPNLCAEHCRYGQQSDHAPTLTVPAALLTTLFITPYVTNVAMRPRPAADASRASASVDPPHAILHCCFRT